MFGPYFKTIMLTIYVGGADLACHDEKSRLIPVMVECGLRIS